MRSIDADVLHKAYMELRNFKQDPQSGDWISLRAVPLTTVVRMLNEAPTIDAVSVVRCKECKWYDNGQNESDSWNCCTRHFGHYIDVNDDDFCSYGERSDDGKDIQSTDE